jgi:hypothetical protein
LWHEILACTIGLFYFKESVMKRVIYSALLSWIVVGGLFVGMFKGQEVRQKWVAKKKSRYEEKKSPVVAEVNLDDFEISTYHS